VKLEGLAGDIGKFGTAAAVLTFLILITHYYIDCIRGSEQFTSIETLQNLADSFMIAITIIVVAVPEVLLLKKYSPFRVFLWQSLLH
jgi:Ca2+ transporting ATPase